MQRMKYPWKLYQGQRLLDMGQLEAEDERAGLRAVLGGAHEADIDPEGFYRIEVGELSVSSEGCDFMLTSTYTGQDQKDEVVYAGVSCTDKITGRALESGRKGELIRVRLDDYRGQCEMECGENIESGDPLRVGAGGWLVFGPPPHRYNNIYAKDCVIDDNDHLADIHALENVGLSVCEQYGHKFELGSLGCVRCGSSRRQHQMATRIIKIDDSLSPDYARMVLKCHVQECARDWGVPEHLIRIHFSSSHEIHLRI